MQGMTPQIIIVLGIMLVASVMLVTELVRSDVVALLTLSALGLSGLVVLTVWLAPGDQNDFIYFAF